MERPSIPDQPGDAVDTGNVRCANCGAPFTCGIAAGKGTCWCFSFPNALPVPKEGEKQGCWCAACLRQKIDAEDAAQPH
jgi:hypothetical protein